MKNKAALRRFDILATARARIELAVLDAMPLVFSERKYNAMCQARDYSYIKATWDAVNKATRKAYLEAGA